MTYLNIRRTATATALLAILFLAGCATTPSTWHESGVTLEGVESSTARIGRLYLKAANGATLLRGDVIRRVHAHGQIPGHLHIEIISPQGVVVREANIGYSRQSSNTHDGSFEIPLTEPIATGSTIRVTHHDTLSHLSDDTETLWRDAGNSNPAE